MGSNEESQARIDNSFYEKDVEKDAMKYFMAVAGWGLSGAASGLVKSLRQKFVCLQKLNMRERSYKLSTRN